jgi:flagellar protein FlbD
VTLTTGDRVVVAESDDEVVRRAVAYQQSKNLIPAPRPASPDAGQSKMVNQEQDV